MTTLETKALHWAKAAAYAAVGVVITGVLALIPGLNLSSLPAWAAPAIAAAVPAIALALQSLAAKVKADEQAEENAAQAQQIANLQKQNATLSAAANPPVLRHSSLGSKNVVKPPTKKKR